MSIIDDANNAGYSEGVSAVMDDLCRAEERIAALEVRNELLEAVADAARKALDTGLSPEVRLVSLRAALAALDAKEGE